MFDRTLALKFKLNNAAEFAALNLLLSEGVFGPGLFYVVMLFVDNGEVLTIVRRKVVANG